MGLEGLSFEKGARHESIKVITLDPGDVAIVKKSVGYPKIGDKVRFRISMILGSCVCVVLSGENKKAFTHFFMPKNFNESSPQKLGVANETFYSEGVYIEKYLDVVRYVRGGLEAVINRTFPHLPLTSVSAEVFGGAQNFPENTQSIFQTGAQNIAEAKETLSRLGIVSNFRETGRQGGECGGF